MNAKFYVPFETAKLLKAKGYPQSGSDMYYDLCGNLTPDNGFIPIDDDVCAAAPAYCEVLDWLVGKDIYIDVDVDRIGYLLFESGLRWHCYIWERDEKTGCRNTRGYETREQAINEAIVKVLKDMI